MRRVAHPVRLTKDTDVASAEYCDPTGSHKTYVDTPTERGDTRPNDWILVDCNDLFVLED